MAPPVPYLTFVLWWKCSISSKGKLPSFLCHLSCSADPWLSENFNRRRSHRKSVNQVSFNYLLDEDPKRRGFNHASFQLAKFYHISLHFVPDEDACKRRNMPTRPRNISYNEKFTFNYIQRIYYRIRKQTVAGINVIKRDARAMFPSGFQQPSRISRRAGNLTAKLHYRVRS